MEKLVFSPEALDSLVEALPDELFLAKAPLIKPEFSEENYDHKKNNRPKQKRRATTNSERCQRYREKLRTEENQVYKENAELKQEREDFQRKITELELEVQALRGQGVVDLSKENELLRQEIEKHKRYIERVVQVTRETELDVEQEEQRRLLKRGLESAAGQTVGILYSSLSDSSWQPGHPIYFDSSADLQLQLIWRYQYLPTGSDAETAKRVNMRLDLMNLPFKREHVTEYIWGLTKQIDKWEEKLTKYTTMNFLLESVHPAFDYGDDEHINCSRLLLPKENPQKQVVFVQALKTAEIYPAAFDSSSVDEVDFLLTPQRCKIIIGTCSDVEINDPDPGLERINETYLEGFVMRDGGNGSTHLTHVLSAPNEDETFKALLNPDNQQKVVENGELNEAYRKAWDIQLQDLIQTIRRMESDISG